MVSNRTASAGWKSIRRRMIRQAKNADLTHCPHCHRLLDFDSYQQTNSAEVDHIVPASAGGTDEASNLVVICRACNLSKGDRAKPKGGAKPVIEEIEEEYPIDGNWLDAVLPVAGSEEVSRGRCRRGAL